MSDFEGRVREQGMSDKAKASKVDVLTNSCKGTPKALIFLTINSLKRGMILNGSVELSTH